MRTKTFLFILICLLGSLLLVMFSNQRPTIKTLVSETHKQLNNLKNFKENLKEVEERKLIADKKYLDLLGFIDEPRLYPHQVWDNITLPLVVSAVLPGKVQVAIGFIRSAQHFVPQLNIIIVDLGASRSGIDMILKFCNDSRCSMTTFPYDKFPSHVSDLSIHAYRPIIIQDMLNKAGSVLWLDIDYRFTTHNIKPFMEKTQNVGILAWTNGHPTTAHTHSKMFGYFRTTAESFYFHRMVGLSQLLVYNLPKIHQHVMLPLIQCVLTPDCLSPIGAQASGCRFSKKPHYRYSGCHGYDVSAFNIVLGLTFDFQASRYTTDETFFRPLLDSLPPEKDIGLNHTVELTTSDENKSETLKYL